LITLQLLFALNLSFSAPCYNTLQRFAYLGVVFVLFPAMIWTGLAMSPAVTSAIPLIVTVLGGHQSARTIHFFVSLALVVFVVAHIGMILLAGFRRRMLPMLTGRAVDEKEQS
jgi:thiosulfate reductase cytochrome b subunit